MAVITILAFFLFCHLPLLNSAEDGNNSKPICPKSFKCQHLGNLTFPFYNSSDPRCGLFKLICSEKVPKLQLVQESRFFNVTRFANPQSILVHDQVLQQGLENRDCSSLKGLYLPNSPSISLTIHNKFITIFKCSKTSELEQDQRFHNYYSFKECKQNNFYYRYPNDQLPIVDGLPNDCLIIQLPMLPPNLGPTRKNASNLFELLTADLTLNFQVSGDCEKCHSRNGQCKTADGFNFYCSDSKERRSLTLILATAIPGTVLIICLVVFIIWRRKKSSNLSTYYLPNNNSSDIEDGSSYNGVPLFSYKDLEEATHNFDPSKEIGDGGFGTVYHGKLRDGREVAVKRLYENNYKRVAQFMNEIDILTRLRHPNLVLLYGSTSPHSRQLLLVYEYITNGTVADHLHGDKAKNEPLTWPVRLNIAMETASALAYLHNSDIIHRDVKTNNILLDNNFAVKVADFGLSRLFPTDVTHVSTAPQGTPGYVDPEYHQCYQLTDKSDVYSFGVVLIELISSLPAVDISRQRNEINLANLAIDRIQRCAFDELIDPSLGYESDATTERMITSVAELAFRCLQLDKDLRPTMDEVLECLKQIQGVDVSQIARPPPSPELENVVLLKDDKLTDSPVDVTEKWNSRSTTSSTTR